MIKKLTGTAAALVFLAAFGLVGNMDYQDAKAAESHYAARAALHYMLLHKYADQAWADDLEAAIAAAMTPNPKANRRSKLRPN
jgi:hypothetical protein